jgi:hypothetical protein
VRRFRSTPGRSRSKSTARRDACGIRADHPAQTPATIVVEGQDHRLVCERCLYAQTDQLLLLAPLDDVEAELGDLRVGEMAVQLVGELLVRLGRVKNDRVRKP